MGHCKLQPVLHLQYEHLEHSDLQRELHLQHEPLEHSEPQHDLHLQHVQRQRHMERQWQRHLKERRPRPRRGGAATKSTAARSTRLNSPVSNRQIYL